MAIKILDPRNFRHNADASKNGYDLKPATIVVGESQEESLEKGHDFFLIPMCSSGHRVALPNGVTKKLTISRADDAVEECVVCATVVKTRRRIPAKQTEKGRARRRIEAIREAQELGLSVSDIL